MRNVLYGFVALLLFAVVLAGCQKKEETVEPLQTISVYGAFVDQEETRFEAAMAAFTAETGVTVDYRGDKQFEAQIVVQVEAGDPPDSAPIPQPGSMQNFARRGKIYPLPQSVVDRIEANYTTAWKDLGSFDGKVYGVFHRVNAKSFVWYNKPAFEAAGYQIPKTWDELQALMDQIVADGGVPWSIGIESGAATGWAATDWMEDIMLRTAGPEVYDQWVAHEIPFNDPAVRKAADTMAGIWLNDKYVLGGTQSIATTNFGDAVLPLFTNPPQAWLHRQGNFITGFMQTDVQADLANKVGVFALPQIDPKWGTPVLGGGDQFVMFNDNPSVHDFLAYLTTWESAKSWAAAGGALFPHQDQDFGDYGSAIEAELAKILVNAEVFRFDASDLMPAEVGAGSFWTGMADLTTGVPVGTVLDEIEASWPK
jgi:alpha-glucoside transport system substrate-binding protein